jgi:hypothetical protein
MSIANDFDGSQALADTAKLQAEAESLMLRDTMKSVIVERSVHVFSIIGAMVKAGDRKRFKRTLTSSA